MRYILTLAIEVNIERIVCISWIPWETFLAAGGCGYDPGCRQVSAHAGMPVGPLPSSKARWIETSLCWYETKGRGIQMKNTFRNLESEPSKEPPPHNKDFKMSSSVSTLVSLSISRIASVTPGTRKKTRKVSHLWLCWVLRNNFFCVTWVSWRLTVCKRLTSSGRPVCVYFVL